MKTIGNTYVLLGMRYEHNTNDYSLNMDVAPVSCHRLSRLRASSVRSLSNRMMTSTCSAGTGLL